VSFAFTGADAKIQIIVKYNAVLQPWIIGVNAPSSDGTTTRVAISVDSSVKTDACSSKGRRGQKIYN